MGSKDRGAKIATSGKHDKSFQGCVLITVCAEFCFETLSILDPNLML